VSWALKLDGMRLLLSAQSLSLMCATIGWWRVHKSETAPHISQAAWWTSIAFAGAALCISVILMVSTNK
jgi:hypothetical protein